MTDRCRDDPSWSDPDLAWRKDGKPRKVNQYPTNCCLCGDRLLPGEALVGGVADDGRLRWLCGPARYQRP